MQWIDRRRAEVRAVLVACAVVIVLATVALGFDADHANYRGLDLRGESFRGLHFFDVDFTGADLTGADMNGFICEFCDFSYATMSWLSAHDAVFFRAYFIGTVAEGAVFGDTSFFRSVSDGFTCQECSFTFSDLNETSFARADFRRSIFYNVEWRDSDLRTTTFQGATLFFVDFTGSRLSPDCENCD